MKKILVIGCSFTAGSYISTYKNLDNSQYLNLTNVRKRPIDEINDIRGWWYYGLSSRRAGLGTMGTSASTQAS